MRYHWHIVLLLAPYVLLGSKGLSSTANSDVMFKAVADIRENSPKEDLRLSLFKNPKEPSCQTVKTHPRGETDIDPTLSRFLVSLINTIQKKNDKDLQPLFHPRLNVSLNALAEILARMDNTYGAPLDISIYRLWALNTADGSPQTLSCPGERLHVYAQYGYPLQFGLWLQAMGTKELGRIYVSIVPVAGTWQIGGFHVEQRTHESKDAESWASEAEKDKAKGLKESAFAKYDLAVKLSDAGKLLELADHEELIKKRDAVQSRSEWEKSIMDAAKPAQVLYSATILVIGGAGIVIRQKIDAEISVEAMKKDCKALTQRIKDKSWSGGLVGVRCAYNLPKEDPKTDGALGGLFVAFSELTQQK